MAEKAFNLANGPLHAVCIDLVPISGDNFKIDGGRRCHFRKMTRVGDEKIDAVNKLLLDLAENTQHKISTHT